MSFATVPLFFFYYVEKKNEVSKFTLLRLVDFKIISVLVVKTKYQITFNNEYVLTQILVYNVISTHTRPALTE
jgi:hypothetical protein